MIDQITFYITAAIMLIFSVMAVTSRMILRAAVSMLFVLIATAVLFYMLKYNFLAAVQLTVYAGGVVVLIIFSIVLTHQSGQKLIKQSFKQISTSAIITLTGAALAVYILLDYTFVKTQQADIEPSIRNIGLQLLSNDKFGYAFPFEVVSVLLLAALVGSIIIAMKPSKKSPEKSVETEKQIPVSNNNN